MNGMLTTSRTLPPQSKVQFPSVVRLRRQMHFGLGLKMFSVGETVTK